MAKKLIVAGVAVAALAIVGLSSTYVVDERQQVIVLQFGGYVRTVDKPGLYFKLPFIQTVESYDKRVLDSEVDLSEVPTSDQKQIVVDTYVRYKIVDPLKYYQATRTNPFERQLNTFVDTNVRAVFASVDLQALLSERRAQLMIEITRRVRTSSVEFGVQVLDVRVKRIDLPAQNSKAVFDRMETQRRQEAIRIRAEGERESLRIRADADKEVRIILAEAQRRAQELRGEGDAKSQEILNAAFGKDPEFFRFWQCINTVREGLKDGARYVGSPSAETIWQICAPPASSEGPPKKAEAPKN